MHQGGQKIFQILSLKESIFMNIIVQIITVFEVKLFQASLVVCTAFSQGRENINLNNQWQLGCEW